MGDSGNAMMRNLDAGVQSRTKGPNRANTLQLKLIGQGHPTGLTSNLLKLFEARPPPEYKPPIEKPKLPAYTGIAQFVSQFAEPGDPEYAHPFTKGETRAAKKARIRQLKLEEGAAKVAEELQKYDPQSDPSASGDPYKTLFVARLSYETSEHRIKKEFETYGPIKRVRLVNDKETKKSRGYAFVEYAHTRDMKNAYKQADGRKLDNKRLLVDVERGRTVPNWRPRRLGGGVGSRRTGADHKSAAREQQLVGQPRSEEPRRDDHHADRNFEKSRKRVREKDQDERIREHLHDQTRDRVSREGRHSHRGHDRTLDKNQGRDREGDRGRERDRTRHDRDKHRDHGRDYDRGERREHKRTHHRHHDRGRDHGEGYEHADNRDGGRHLHERGAYGDGDPRHERNMPGYGQDYGYNEQRKRHDAYGYGQDGLDHETEHSKPHETIGKTLSHISTEPRDQEEGEEYKNGDY